jgi:hypothetical protein
MDGGAMRLFIVLASVSFVLSSTIADACISDYDCGYGRKCIKAAGDINANGVCVQPVDSNGNKDYRANSNWGKSQPTAVKSCQFDTDCGIGGSCMKKSGSIYGICFK